MKKYRPPEPDVAAARTSNENPAQPKDVGWRCLRTDGRCGFIALLLPAVLAVACQKLDPNLASGQLSEPDGTGGVDGVPMGGGLFPNGSGSGGRAGPGSSCTTLRTQVYDVLQTNCAICHQSPGTPVLYMGNFNFILDLAQLTANTSPQSSTILTLKYVVKGNASRSYIYQRITDNSMPPVTRTQRPTSDDVQVLRQWITSCIDDPTSPEGWSGSGSPTDAGVDSGPMLEGCGSANVCPAGGCCVFNQCRPNGTTCGPLPNPIPGQTDLPGFPGMCTSGSCQNSAGDSCGKVGEPCCDFQSCTASQSSCLTTDMTMCSACGQVGQPCCKPNSCLDGRACVGGGVGRVGTCQLCGALGQPCCGSGVAALQMCNGTLTCMTVAGMGNVCTASGGGGTATGTGGAARGGGAGGRAATGAGGRGGAG
jgi:hypothetical protein